jgi:hypothetical protein
MRDELNRVRESYTLQTSHRDVAKWLDWAFSLDPPAGFSGNTLEPVSQVRSSPTPRPAARNADDDEAVEMVWGTNEGEATNSPVVLEDVPDVSEKHYLRADTLPTENHDSVDSVGDIPLHQPSHGSRPAGIDDENTPALPRARTSNPPPTSSARDSSLSMDELFGLDDPAGQRQPRLHHTTAPPVVRFSPSQSMAAVRPPSPDLAESRIEPLRPPPRTRPGVQPAVVRKAAPVAIAPATQKMVIGASMVERNKPRRWPLVLGLVLLAGGGAGVALYVTSTMHATPTESAPVAPAAGPATVKFDVTPTDAEIRVDGQSHAGSPWAIELAAGVHQIEIHRTGFTAYLTSLELAAADKHSLHIELRPLGTTASTTEATLSISTTPSGLEAELDGNLLPQRTPIKMQIKVGSHVIVVKKGGLEVWRQTVNAEAASDIELEPSFAAAATPAPAIQVAQPPAPSPEPVVVVDAAAAPEPVPVPMPQQEVVPAPPPPPPTPIVPTGPVTVAPNAVTKLSGDAPNISRLRSQNLPAVAAAKLCIDAAGSVSSVDFVGKLDKKVAGDLAEQLKTWKYQPYVKAGTALSACFVVTMRMK